MSQELLLIAEKCELHVNQNFGVAYSNICLFIRVEPTCGPAFRKGQDTHVPKPPSRRLVRVGGGLFLERL